MDFRSTVVKALSVMLLAAPLCVGCSSDEETGPTEEPNVGPGAAAPAKAPAKSAAPVKSSGASAPSKDTPAK
jgi:hypothetical protein